MSPVERMFNAELQTLGQFELFAAIILSGAAESSVIDMRGVEYGSFAIPSAFTGATVSFKASFDGTNFVAAYDTANALISITVNTSRAYPIPLTLIGHPFLTILSASNEGADRTILVSRKG